MGYTTEFSGVFSINKPLDKDTADFLRALNKTRRMKRNVDPKYGVEGEFYVEGDGDFGQDHEDNIINYNVPPSTQPGLWCQWTPTDDNKGIEWDGGEKFYHAAEWIEYIIEKILAPKGYILNGSVEAQGEETSDHWWLRVKDNKASIMDVDTCFEVTQVALASTEELPLLVNDISNSTASELLKKRLAEGN